MQLNAQFLKFAACAFMPMGVQRNVYKEASPKGPPIWINFFPEGVSAYSCPPCWHMQCPHPSK